METKRTGQHLGDPNSIQNQPPAITFRPFKYSNADVDAVMDFGTDQRVNRTLQFNPFSGRDDAAHFIDAFILPHPWFRLVCFAGGAADHPIGFISLRPEDSGGGRRRVSIGYSVVPEFWGRGIATAAVRMAAAAAFEEWPGVERVEAMVFLDNPASERVLEKAGFQKEAVLRKYFVAKGEARDVVLYGFVDPDFRDF